jgi:hypothetical protein
MVICSTLTVTGSTIGPTRPTIFALCWGVGLGTGSCGMSPSLPAVKAGNVVTIQADIVNYDYPGKVGVDFKIDGTLIASLDNASLGLFPSGGIWNARATYTMPNKNVTLVIETYGWNSSTSSWALTDSKTNTISMTAPGCTGVSLSPFSATLDNTSTTNNKVTLTATVTPFGTGGASFPVTFKDASGAVLGTCSTNVNTGICTYVFDSTGRTAGTYNIIAYAGSGNSCYSTTAVIIVNQPIRQWNFGVTVKDSLTGASVQDATILVATTGKASQSKSTDASGFASFRMDEGSVSISIKKSGYNNYSTTESIYSDVVRTYTLTATPSVPTVGDVQFVSVPSNAEIIIDGKDLGVKTPLTVTGLKNGSHNWTLKLSGYNDSNGTVNVPSGGSTNVYTTMTPITSGTGSLNITSHPVMDGEVFVDDNDMNVKTSGLTTITEIPPGTHTYKVVLSGYANATGTFDIKAGETQHVDAELIPLTSIGTLEITSEPSGALTYIDGSDTKRITPSTIINLIAGNHTYKLTLSGYKDVSGTVSIIAGGTKTIHLTLEKAAVSVESGTVILIGVGIVAMVMLSGKK